MRSPTSYALTVRDHRKLDKYIALKINYIEYLKVIPKNKNKNASNAFLTEFPNTNDSASNAVPSGTSEAM